MAFFNIKLNQYALIKITQDFKKRKEMKRFLVF